MNIKYITMVTAVMAFSVVAFAETPDDTAANQNRMAPQASNDYWQAPNWPNGDAPPAYNSAPSELEPSESQTSGAAPSGNRPAPAWNTNYRAPAHLATPNYYGQTYPSNNYPAQNSYPSEMNQSGWNYGTPPQQMQNTYPGYSYPAPRGPYPGGNSYQYHPNNAMPAYSHPGYGTYGQNNARHDNRQNDQFWGNSQPNHWANPNKGNMRQGWNNMNNGPSRMGEMPGGWQAPKFSTPNPVDMTDQVQDNAGQLPEQMRDIRR